MANVDLSNAFFCPNPTSYYEDVAKKVCSGKILDFVHSGLMKARPQILSEFFGPMNFVYFSTYSYARASSKSSKDRKFFALQ